MRPGVDVIVVSYHSPLDLSKFLASIREHPPHVPWTLTVVNVAPTREDKDAALENLNYSCTSFSYITFDENVGYARAVNRAAQNGFRETIAIFNADTILYENVVNDCHVVLQSKSDWGVLGPRQTDEQGRITHGGFFPNERGFRHPNSHEFGDVRDDATTVSGSAYFIKRKVWDELSDCPLYHNSYPEAEGAFLPTKHFYEETWCSYHARAHGYKVVYYGPVTMIHKVGKPNAALEESKKMFEEACEAHGI